jgi:hypothetical protein
MQRMNPEDIAVARAFQQPAAFVRISGAGGCAQGVRQ